MTTSLLVLPLLRTNTHVTHQCTLNKFMQHKASIVCQKSKPHSDVTLKKK